MEIFAFLFAAATARVINTGSPDAGRSAADCVERHSVSEALKLVLRARLEDSLRIRRMHAHVDAVYARTMN